MSHAQQEALRRVAEATEPIKLPGPTARILHMRYGFIAAESGGWVLAPAGRAHLERERLRERHAEVVAKLTREDREYAERIVENVSNILALHDGGVWGTVLGDLAALRYDVWWDCLPAAAFGAPHLRDRVFAVAADSDRGRLLGGEEQRGGSQQRPRAGQREVGRPPAPRPRRRGAGMSDWPNIEAKKEHALRMLAHLRRAIDYDYPASTVRQARKDADTAVTSYTNGLEARARRDRYLILGRRLLAPMRCACLVSWGRR